MYKLLPPYIDGQPNNGVMLGNSYIPFDPANTDYTNFKAQILADEAELQDADGNLMSPEEAKAFVKELP